MAAISGIARLDKGWEDEGLDGRGRWRELKREVDQYMDSDGDKITVGCLGKIAAFRVQTCASE